MAILSTVPNVIQATMNYIYGGIHCQNVLAFKPLSGTITVPMCESLTEELETAFDLYIMPLLVDGILLVNIEAKSLDFDYPYEFSRTVASQGSAAGSGLPINCAVMTQFITGQIGRSFKGRAYLPGIPEAQVDVRVVQPTYQAAHQLAWESVNADLFGADFQHGVVSRIQGGVQIDPADFTSVTFYATSPIVADMGRRIDN